MVRVSRLVAYVGKNGRGKFGLDGMGGFGRRGHSRIAGGELVVVRADDDFARRVFFAHGPGNRYQVVAVQGTDQRPAGGGVDAGAGGIAFTNQQRTARLVGNGKKTSGDFSADEKF